MENGQSYSYSSATSRFRVSERVRSLPKELKKRLPEFLIGAGAGFAMRGSTRWALEGLGFLSAPHIAIAAGAVSGATLGFAKEYWNQKKKLKEEDGQILEDLMRNTFIIYYDRVPTGLLGRPKWLPSQLAKELILINYKKKELIDATLKGAVFGALGAVAGGLVAEFVIQNSDIINWENFRKEGFLGVARQLTQRVDIKEYAKQKIEGIKTLPQDIEKKAMDITARSLLFMHDHNPFQSSSVQEVVINTETPTPLQATATTYAARVSTAAARISSISIGNEALENFRWVAAPTQTALSEAVSAEQTAISEAKRNLITAVPTYTETPTPTISPRPTLTPPPTPLPTVTPEITRISPISTPTPEEIIPTPAVATTPTVNTPIIDGNSPDIIAEAINQSGTADLPATQGPNIAPTENIAVINSPVEGAVVFPSGTDNAFFEGSPIGVESIQDLGSIDLMPSEIALPSNSTVWEQAEKILQIYKPNYSQSDVLFLAKEISRQSDITVEEWGIYGRYKDTNLTPLQTKLSINDSVKSVLKNLFN